jgi:hypothetical protein
MRRLGYLQVAPRNGDNVGHTRLWKQDYEQLINHYPCKDNGTAGQQCR